MHLSAAFQNGFRQLRGDRDTGGVVRLAEKDKVDILSQSIEKLLGQMKPIFFRQIPEANGTAEFRQGPLIFGKGRGEQKSTPGPNSAYNPVNQVGSAVPADDAVVRNAMARRQRGAQTAAKRVGITICHIQGVRRCPDCRLRHAKRADAGGKIQWETAVFICIRSPVSPVFTYYIQSNHLQKQKSNKRKAEQRKHTAGCLHTAGTSDILGNS